MLSEKIFNPIFKDNNYCYWSFYPRLRRLWIFLYLKNGPFNPNYAYILYSLFIGLYVSAIPIFIALYHAYQLLQFIDNKKVFSIVSVKALKTIKICAYIICGLYVVIIPFVYILANKDDAPGLIIVGVLPIFVAFVIAVFADVLQRILIDAIKINYKQII